MSGGLAKGTHWTLYPYLSYWRGNTEMDVEAATGNVRGAACWDLGTHFGIYTVGMAMVVWSDGEVAGFEPDPVSYMRCQRHVQRNSLSPGKLFNAAVSNVQGTGSLRLKQGAGAITSYFAYEDEQPMDRVGEVTVKNVVSII